MTEIFSKPIQQQSHSETADSGQNSRVEVREITPPDSVVHYEKEHNRPYTVDYFQLLEYNDIARKPEMDVMGILPRISDIEEYIRNSIEVRGLEDNLKTYKFLLSEIYKKIGRPPVEDIRNTFERVSVYAKKNKDVRRAVEVEGFKAAIKELDKKLEAFQWQQTTE